MFNLLRILKKKVPPYHSVFELKYENVLFWYKVIQNGIKKTIAYSKEDTLDRR